MFIVIALAWRRKAALNLNESWPSSGDRKIRRGRLSLLPQQCHSQATQDSLWTSTACTVSIAKSDQMSLALYPAVQLHSRFTHPHSSWSAAAVSSGSISCCLLSAVSLGCSLSQQPVCCKLSAFSANCCFATASCSSRCSSITAGQSQKSNAKHSKTCVSFPWSHLTLFATAPFCFF